jgi:hypothetical protein
VRWEIMGQTGQSRISSFKRGDLSRIKLVDSPDKGEIRLDRVRLAREQKKNVPRQTGVHESFLGFRGKFWIPLGSYYI